MNAPVVPVDAEPVLLAGWRRALWARLCRDKLLKCSTTVLGTALFFWAYFAVMRAPLSTPTLVPVTRWDYLVPISESAIFWYASLWAYIPIATAMTRTRADLWAYCAGAVGMSLLGLLTFWLMPTAVPDLPIDWQLYPKLAFMKNADVSGNALPSMHVAFAVFTAGAIELQCRQIRAPGWLRAANAFWALAIVYSTMATRQHLVIDVAGGALLGAAAIALGLRRYWRPSSVNVSASR